MATTGHNPACAAQGPALEATPTYDPTHQNPAHNKPRPHGHAPLRSPSKTCSTLQGPSHKAFSPAPGGVPPPWSRPLARLRPQQAQPTRAHFLLKGHAPNLFGSTRPRPQHPLVLPITVPHTVTTPIIAPPTLGPTHGPRPLSRATPRPCLARRGPAHSMVLHSKAPPQAGSSIGHAHKATPIVYFQPRPLSPAVQDPCEVDPVARATLVLWVCGLGVPPAGRARTSQATHPHTGGVTEARCPPGNQGTRRREAGPLAPGSQCSAPRRKASGVGQGSGGGSRSWVQEERSDRRL